MLSVGNFFYYLLTCSKMQQANYMHIVCRYYFYIDFNKVLAKKNIYDPSKP